MTAMAALAVDTGSCGTGLSDADKITVALAVDGGTPLAACPAGCQASVDTVYSTCDCADDWDEAKPTVKAMATAYGCGGANQAAPLLALVAAVANHFLN